MGFGNKDWACSWCYYLWEDCTFMNAA